VPAKAPLPEEAIFKLNQAAAEKWRAAHKAEHKAQDIAKHDRNDDRIKCCRVGERDVSFDEDPSPAPAWGGDEPSVAVDWSDISGSSTPSPPRAVEVTSSQRPEPAVCEGGTGSSSRSGARPVREDQWATHSPTTPGGLGASEVQRDQTRRGDLKVHLGL
jgi:hypothetical protein